MTTQTFKPGQQLAVRSLGDWDCIYRFSVVSRTAKFVTLQYYNDLKRVGIKVDRDGVEYCLPFGNYSMSALLRCTDDAETV